MAKFFHFEDGVLQECDRYPESFGISFVDADEVFDNLVDYLDQQKVIDLYNTKYTGYERGEDYQCLILNPPDTLEIGKRYGKILMYCNMRGVSVIATRGEKLSGIVDDFCDKLEKGDIPHFIAAFLSGVVSHDYICMEGVEKDLGKLESDIISSHSPNCGEKINDYRRRVAVIKRYYEQLFEACDTLCEEDWLSSAQEELKKIKEKTQRLRQDAMYLRDYMSQVREAYQQAIDLSLNSIMKFLSAITLLFAPLTLLVGWYGMNFSMPETEWSAGYVIPIILAITIIVVGIVVFKKRKWM